MCRLPPEVVALIIRYLIRDKPEKLTSVKEVHEDDLTRVLRVSRVGCRPV